MQTRKNKFTDEELEFLQRKNKIRLVEIIIIGILVFIGIFSELLLSLIF